MGVASGCGVQEAGVASGSGWNLWVWLLAVVVRMYIDFLILLIPTPLVSVLILQQHPYFLFIYFNVFVLIIIYVYIIVMDLIVLPDGCRSTHCEPALSNSTNCKECFKARSHCTLNAHSIRFNAHRFAFTLNAH